MTDSMQETGGALDELVDYVFSKPPQAYKAVQLQLSDDSDVADGGTLQMLMSAITGKGAEKLFGVKSCSELSKGQADKLQEYLHSMGFKMVAKCGDTGDDPWSTTKDFKEVVISYAFV